MELPPTGFNLDFSFINEKQKEVGKKKSPHITFEVEGVRKEDQDSLSTDTLLAQLGPPFSTILPPVIGRVNSDLRPIFIDLLSKFHKQKNLISILIKR